MAGGPPAPLAPHVRVVEPALSEKPVAQLYVAETPSDVPLGVLTEPFVGFDNAPQSTGSQVGAALQLPAGPHVSV